MIEDLQAEAARLKQVVDSMEVNRELQLDEICALKAEALSYRSELEATSLKSQELESVGKDVRMRYLECHRSRMGKQIGKAGHGNIKSGDRAAHRGRPLADALLYQEHQRSDTDVYKDLYGIGQATMRLWKDVPEVVEISGFHGSLQSERKLSDRFRVLFGQFVESATAYPTPTKLREAFKEDTALQCKHSELQDCYDEIIATNRPGQRSTVRL